VGHAPPGYDPAATGSNHGYLVTTNGRLALITGANRGLGLAISMRLHEMGHPVIVTARDTLAAADAAASIGADVRSLALDVTDWASVREAKARTGPVDILVNNAGVLLDWGCSPSSISLDLVGRELAVNLFGAWRVSQAFLPGMLSRSWGRIVMISSGTGLFSSGLFTRAPAYSLSKAALNALTVLLAEETRDRGVLVNAVNPGLVRTRMRPDAERLPEAAAEDIAWAATLPEGGPSGVLFRGRHIARW
jgi:NAD(P)-dependent dehydrogenase (short-subunit alcohol dehydrogenase family)